ncbi:hypothetical protein MAMMFC1_02018 [Methylomusa anaerophila]|uniref:Uncharacterized protein n=1 Tax=Methylomusa anaerophila TaxID=1930071 RepID=A0A348AJU2_9FIRM|nr:hypothetical protein MAMMFC1_02018 [Methylomusa anaerophila]
MEERPRRNILNSEYGILNTDSETGRDNCE